MTSPATPDYDKFEVGDNTFTGVTLHFYNHERIIIVQDTTNLEEFCQILKSQDWIDVCLKLETPSAPLTFGIMPNAETLTFSVDGKLWNLENKDVYNHITKQVDLLTERLILHKVNQDRAKELPYRSKITRESVSPVVYEHVLTLVSNYSSGGTQHYYIGRAGFGELLRALVDLEDNDFVTYEVRKEGVEGFDIRDDPDCHCVHVNIKYQNGTARNMTLSYYDIRSLAADLHRWQLPEVLEGYGDTFDLNTVRVALRTKYDRDSNVKHMEEVAPPVSQPASPVGITEVCKFLIDHPEYHTTMLAIIREMEAKRVPTKP